MTGHLKIVMNKWHEGAAKWLRAACDDTYTVEMLGQDVAAENCRLFDIHNEQGEHVSSFVIRLDECGSIKELVVVAAGGYLPGDSLYRIVTPYIETLAAMLDATYLRGHAQRKGIGRLLERAGWQQSEIVYRKRVGHGRKVIQ